MGVPKQSIGLSIKKCVPNPDAIRAITFTTPTNLSVVNGSNTEISIPLDTFFVPVYDASSTSFSMPGKQSGAVPFQLTKLNLAGIDGNTGLVKFIALLPQYPAGTATDGGPDIYSNLSTYIPSGGGISSNQYMEWALDTSIEDGELEVTNILGPSTSNFSSLLGGRINRMEYGYGSYYSFTGGTGPVYFATQGGLMKYDGVDMTLWSTMNSNSSCDYINSIVVDPNNNIWVGSSAGISKFNENPNEQFNQFLTTSNSGIISNVIRDIALYPPYQLMIGTDNGFSSFDFTNGYTAGVFTNFTIYNTPSLLSNNINRIAVDTVNGISYIGTDQGISSYNILMGTWGDNYNSLATTGWTGSDNINALVVYGTLLYASTQDGILQIDTIGNTASVYTTSQTNMSSNWVTALRYVNYRNVDQLYAGNVLGEMSIFGLTGGTWSATSTFSNLVSLGISDILIDNLSNSNSAVAGNQTVLASNGDFLCSGIFNNNELFAQRNVPESTKSSNLLLSVPEFTAQLYSIDQPIYFEFSKSMVVTSVQFRSSLWKGTTSTGSTVSGTWSWSNNDRSGVFTPSNQLERASLYTLVVAHGATATDGTYLKESLVSTFYTEDIVPILGWQPIGKMMVLSGTEGNYTQGIYLRNPQGFPVDITTLIGR